MTILKITRDKVIPPPESMGVVIPGQCFSCSGQRLEVLERDGHYFLECLACREQRGVTKAKLQAMIEKEQRRRARTRTRSRGVRAVEDVTSSL